jgi:mono/diheme cytochrome c family protein
MKMRWLQFVLLLLLSVSQAHVAASAKGDPARGKQIFTAQTCGMCHVNGGNMICPEKPLKGAGFEKKYPKDSMIADVIRHGVKGTSMDSFGKDKLPDPDLQDVIVYIRSLTPASAAAAPPSTKSGAANKAGRPTSPKSLAGSKPPDGSKSSSGSNNAKQTVPPSTKTPSESKKTQVPSKMLHK